MRSTLLAMKARSMLRNLSCLTNSYGRFGPRAAIKHLPTVGIDQIELPIKNQGVPSFFKETPLLTDGSTSSDIAAVRDELAAAGVRLSSCNISSGNPLDPAVVERTITKLDIAEMLGVSRVVAGAGAAPDDADRRQTIRHLRQLATAASDRGILYCCETHPGLCQNAESMLQTLSDVDHPALRINFDTANFFYYNHNVDLPATLLQTREFVAHVHLKDTPGGFEEWHFDQLGTGQIDFGIVRRLLDEVGFTGPYSLELEGIANEPEPQLRDYESRIAASVAHLRNCGFDD
ncbi:MAG: sugar phosphate isomerase/epimerase family protein [Planctomycetaceae bacterium]